MVEKAITDNSAAILFRHTELQPYEVAASVEGFTQDATQPILSIVSSSYSPNSERELFLLMIGIIQRHISAQQYLEIISNPPIVDIFAKKVKKPRR